MGSDLACILGLGRSARYCVVRVSRDTIVGNAVQASGKLERHLSLVPTLEEKPTGYTSILLRIEQRWMDSAATG